MGERRPSRSPHTIIVGADENGERLITALRTQEGSNLDILGVFDDRNDDRVQGICAGVPKLGKVRRYFRIFAQRTRIDLILFFALPISAEKRILQMLKKLWVLPVDIHLSAHTNELRFSVPATIQISAKCQRCRCLKKAYHGLGHGNEINA